MAASQRRTAAEHLRAAAADLLHLANQYEIPSNSMVRVERLIGDVEQVAADVRAVARGRR